MKNKLEIIRIIKSLLRDDSFKERHRVNNTDFTRIRKLTFIILVLLIIQKSLKSIQLVLNEFFKKLSVFTGLAFITVSASAFSKARKKLCHTAFIELNELAIVQPYYSKSNYRTWRGFRLVAIDGSKLRLPDTPEVREVFGTIPFCNEDGSNPGEYPWAIMTACYDLLNEIVLDASIEHSRASEVALAVGHLDVLTDKDLLICDMNFPSYRFLADLIHRKIDFVIRRSRASFTSARSLFNRDDVDSIIVTLKPHHTRKKEIESLCLPMEITVRFVRVVLDNGEIEVLVTSLLDEDLYPSEIFKELYNLRWGVETLFDRLKNRLNLENFSGKTVEAIKQDFYATIFIASLESVLTEDAEEQLAKKTPLNKYPQQVNMNVAYNSIKNYIVELFLTDQDPEFVCDELTRLFITKPVLVRKERKVERKKRKPRLLLNFYKRIKKICF